MHPLNASPLMLQSLDVEPERGRDGVDVLPVELLEDGRLAGVVEAAEKEPGGRTMTGGIEQQSQALSLLLLLLLGERGRGTN